MHCWSRDRVRVWHCVCRGCIVIPCGADAAAHRHTTHNNTPQVVPPGFHLIPLPFKDDIRTPESDPALLSRVVGGHGAGPPRANQDQV